MVVDPALFRLLEHLLSLTSLVLRSKTVRIGQPRQSSGKPTHRLARKYPPPPSRTQNRCAGIGTTQDRRSAHSDFLRNGRISRPRARPPILAYNLAIAHS